MKLLLCSDGDAAAVWAYGVLKCLGCADLELVTTGELANAKQWSHRVTSNGSTVDIVLADGRKITAAEVNGVINRLNWPSGAQIGQATKVDQEYAWQESSAFYLSWLNSFQTQVFNRATPQGLCGSWRSPTQWAVLAGKAGFDVAPCTDAVAIWNSGVEECKVLRTVAAFDGKAFGALDTESISEPCQKLCELSETALLGIDLFQAEDGRWIFHSATPLPDLYAGGVPLLRTIAKSWGNEVMQ